uniref:Uncharacterized protein n=1 Tax=Pipistrellus kuhlii TaxID=59472 RepID=A0A7J7XW36_PIPKU|nr:hypothetical protein mPipKuh1_010499 [Pipistrellus kuhlii]
MSTASLGLIPGNGPKPAVGHPSHNPGSLAPNCSPTWPPLTAHPAKLVTPNALYLPAWLPLTDPPAGLVAPNFPPLQACSSPNCTPCWPGSPHLPPPSPDCLIAPHSPPASLVTPPSLVFSRLVVPQ